MCVLYMSPHTFICSMCVHTYKSMYIPHAHTHTFPKEVKYIKSRIITLKVCFTLTLSSDKPS